MTHWSLHFFAWFFLLTGSLFGAAEGMLPGQADPLKILHISFHKGCINEIEGVGRALSLDITPWFVHELPAGFLDGKTRGSAIYNIGHDRAENIWNQHREFFETFDVILTSDTAPLSRVFLQNGWKKPLIIWICNRFDYYDGASLDCDFPDQEYYDLFRRASKQPNVIMIGYTAFEHLYARNKGIDTGGFTITPCGAFSPEKKESILPAGLNRSESFFLPPYHNETIFMNLSGKCWELGLPNYCGRYNGPMDLVGFKGIIHLPYAWSNLQFFENVQLGIPYFVPSKAFLGRLKQMGNYFLSSLPQWEDEFSRCAEWYSPEHESIITYFDSWEDLRTKIDAADFAALSLASRAHAEKYRKTMLDRWAEVFKRCRILLRQEEGSQ